MLNEIKQYPLVSVVMPAYNAEEYIQESIESVLNQTYENFELIIINDGSKDRSEQIVESYKDQRIKYVNNEINLGVAKSLNLGLSIAKGKYIMRLDSDDIAYPDRMETQVRYLEEHEDIYVLGSGMLAFGNGVSEYKMIPACDPEQLKIDSLFFCPISHPSVMFRRILVDEGFLYNPEYERIEDYELWVRIMKKHIVSAIPDILVRYRIHGKQVTQSHTEEISTAVVKLHKRQLQEVVVSCNVMENDGYIYIKKSIDCADIRRKMDFFNSLLCDSGFVSYYNKELCTDYFYLTIRNELFNLSCTKIEKIKVLNYFGKLLGVRNNRVFLDKMRMLKY